MNNEPSTREPMADPFFAPDAKARRDAGRLLREARHGALATLDALDSLPLATRVAVATDPGGDVLVLVSDLADHTKALAARPVASLLLGSIQPGDALAQPCLTLHCDVERIERASEEHHAARSRFLSRLPKAALYADFEDFAFHRLRIRRATLNGGFARAFRLERGDLCHDVSPELLAREAPVVAHMNEDHADAIQAILRHRRGTTSEGWRIVTLDPLGFEAACDDRLCRVEFITPVETPAGYRDAFVALAREAMA